MLQINGKSFMNIQEAVQWLLENNALPFQSTANYAGETEIAMSTLINPSPAKVRVGSIIFFADSKVSTVIGVTSNSFIVSNQYNDLVDDVVYVSNVSINGSGHLIVTLSNGTNIDAGLIKQVSSFAINGSQHLVAIYNDGTSTDLGAIFSGNINISGTFNATTITGDSIIENMSGYSFITNATTNFDKEAIYAGAVKNGNKLTFVYFAKLTKRTGYSSAYLLDACRFVIPQAVADKLFPTTIGGIDLLDVKTVIACKSLTENVAITGYAQKSTLIPQVIFAFYGVDNFVVDTDYYVRLEVTFLLSENLAS